MEPKTDPDTDDFMAPSYTADKLRRHSASARAQVDLGSMTHRGLVREKNEDCFLVVRATRALQTVATSLPSDQFPEHLDETGFGLLVADGLGGRAAGEVASRLAVQSLITLVLNTPDWIMLAGEPDSNRILERISERYVEVNAKLREEAAANWKLTGMGTTMTLAYSLCNDLFIGHIGDSRAYLLRGETMRLLTRDHTYAQVLADLGEIEPHQIARHRMRHVLVRYLGGDEPAKADVDRVRLQEDDQLLLCTDGLTDMVPNSVIAEILKNATTASDACQQLVDAALKKGGNDNITVVVARYRFPSAP